MISRDISWIMYRLRKEGFVVARGTDLITLSEVIGVAGYIRDPIYWIQVPDKLNREVLLSQLQTIARLGGTKGHHNEVYQGSE